MASKKWPKPHYSVDGKTETWKTADGIIHREDGPAVTKILPNGETKEWYICGVKHREGNPAVISNFKSKYTEEWYFNGLKHREDGPAVVNTLMNRYTTEAWYIDGAIIKEHVYNDVGYPRISYFDNNNLLHKIDGPALIYENIKRWYIHGEEITIAINEWAFEHEIDLDNLDDFEKAIIVVNLQNFLDQ